MPESSRAFRNSSVEQPTPLTKKVRAERGTRSRTPEHLSQSDDDTMIELSSADIITSDEDAETLVSHTAANTIRSKIQETLPHRPPTEIEKAQRSMEEHWMAIFERYSATPEELLAKRTGALGRMKSFFKRRDEQLDFWLARYFHYKRVLEAAEDQHMRATTEQRAQRYDGDVERAFFRNESNLFEDRGDDRDFSVGLTDTEREQGHGFDAEDENFFQRGDDEVRRITEAERPDDFEPPSSRKR